MSDSNNTSSGGEIFSSYSDYLNSIVSPYSRIHRRGKRFKNIAENQDVELMIENSRPTPLFVYSVVLAGVYSSTWMVNRVVNTRIESAIRDVKITCDSLTKEEIDQVHLFIKHNAIVGKIKSALQTAFLFGGSALYFLPLGRDFKSSIKKGEEFYIDVLDPWEIGKSRLGEAQVLSFKNSITRKVEQKVLYTVGQSKQVLSYHSQDVNPERTAVFRSQLEPKNWQKRVTQGWGLSVIDPIVDVINGFERLRDEMFSLLKQASLTVVSIRGWQEELDSDTTLLQSKINKLQDIKESGFLMKDSEDNVERLSLDFSSLGGLYEPEFKILCAATGYPEEILLGQSSKGLNNGGESSIEIYNTQLHSLRESATPAILQVVKMICQVLFGEVPVGLDIDWSPLKVLNEVEQEGVRASKLNGYLMMLQNDCITKEGFMELCEKENLLAGIPAKSLAVPLTEDDDTVVEEKNIDITEDDDEQGA